MTLAPQQPVAGPLEQSYDPLAAAMDDFLCDAAGACDKPLSDMDRELYAMLEAGELFPELPVPDVKAAAQHPFIGGGGGGGTPEPMVEFGELHPEPPTVPAQAAPFRASPSPSSSGTSYKPATAGSDSGSDFTESPKTETSSRKSKSSSKSPKADIRIGRRKPDVDLTSIPDINERRKQRRLAKNRATAATSRARKRALMATLQQQVDQLVEENGQLKGRLAACCCTHGGAAPDGAGAARTRL